MTDQFEKAVLRAAFQSARSIEPTEAEIRDVLEIAAGEQRLAEMTRAFAMVDRSLPFPDAWQDTTEPRCSDCGRTCRPHKGHWTCVARGCSAYGESQGDGAKENDDAS